MKIIDGNGRLFGKVNILDFIVTLFLLSLTPVFFFGYKIITKKPLIILESRDILRVKIDCSFIKLKEDLLKIISVGDKETDGAGRCVGVVLLVGEKRPFYREIYAVSGLNQKFEDPNFKELPVKLLLSVEKIDNILYYRGQALQTDTVFSFQTGKYKVDARLDDPIKLSILEINNENSQLSSHD